MSGYDEENGLLEPQESSSQETLSPSSSSSSSSSSSYSGHGKEEEGCSDLSEKRKDQLFSRLCPCISLSIFGTMEYGISCGALLPFLNNSTFQIVSFVSLTLCYIGMMFCTFTTALIDPGVVPPELGTPEPDPDTLKKGERWCKTCHIVRAPSTTHCSTCGYCVELYDHHCGVVGNCIARRNRRFFIGLLFWGGMGNFMIIAMSITLFVQIIHAHGANMWSYWYTYMLGVYILFVGYLAFSLICFFVFQCFLGAANFTEKDLMGRKVSPGCNDFRSCTSNTYSLCCSPLGEPFSRFHHPNGEKKGFSHCQ